MNTPLQLYHFSAPTDVAVERWPSSNDGILYIVEVPRSDFPRGSLVTMLQLSLVAVHALALRFHWRCCDASTPLFTPVLSERTNQYKR